MFVHLCTLSGCCVLCVASRSHTQPASALSILLPFSLDKLRPVTFLVYIHSYLSLRQYGLVRVPCRTSSRSEASLLCYLLHCVPHSAVVLSKMFVMRPKYNASLIHIFCPTTSSLIRPAKILSCICRLSDHSTWVITLAEVCLTSTVANFFSRSFEEESVFVLILDHSSVVLVRFVCN